MAQPAARRGLPDPLLDGARHHSRSGESYGAHGSSLLSAGCFLTGVAVLLVHKDT